MSATWTRVTTDGVVSKVAALVGSIILTPDSSTNNADASFYDGESAQDPKIIKVQSGAGVTKQVVFDPPLICKRGITMIKGSNVSEALVQWEPLKS